MVHVKHNTSILPTRHCQVFVIALVKLGASNYVQHTLNDHLIPIMNIIINDRTFVLFVNLSTAQALHPWQKQQARGK